MYYIVTIPGFLQVIDYARLFEEQSKVTNDPTKAIARAGARRKK